MNKQIIITAALIFCILLPTGTQAKYNHNPTSPTITLIKLDLSEKTLELCYEIRNESEQDIWICKGIFEGYRDFEVAMAQDGQTLLIRRRLDVPMMGFMEQPFGRYVRIRKNQSRKESFLLPLPVRPRHIFLGGRPLSKVIEHAKRLVIEIGFYSGDMPKMIFDMLQEAERNPQKKHVEYMGYPIDVIDWLDGSEYFNEINESIRNRDEQVVIPWTDRIPKGEQVIRATTTELNIPYIEYPLYPEFTLPILNSCTKLEIEYRPSMLDYFFSDSDQQLMSKTEINYLQSQKTVVVNDKRLIGTMRDEIDQADSIGRIVTESKSAHIACYHGDEHLTSFTAYGKESMLTEEMQCLWHRRSFQSLKMFAAQIKPFELRIKCAANIKNLWYRLRFYHMAEKTRLKGLSSESKMIYPLPTEWCECMLWTYTNGRREKHIIRIHNCPSAGSGKNHYAMNPNCKPDSPADMVLLFETEAGWNQHGGPELFTFDNHDPKGGCVLLNDGTVKFIRTREELLQLRWK